MESVEVCLKVEILTVWHTAKNRIGLSPPGLIQSVTLLYYEQIEDVGRGGGRSGGRDHVMIR